MTNKRHHHHYHKRKWHGVGLIIAIICRCVQIGMLIYGVGYSITQGIAIANAKAIESATPYFTLDGWVAYSGFTNILGVVVIAVIVIAVCQVIYKMIEDKYYW